MRALSLPRKRSVFASAIAAVSTILLPLHADATTVSVIRYIDLANTIGVNTHIIYTDSQYASATNVIAALKYTGIRLIRDTAPNPSNQGGWNYAPLAAAGIRMDLFNGGDAPGGTQNPATAAAAMNALATSYPGSVHAIEGPNEVNNGVVTYAGLTAIPGAEAYQAALYANVRAQSALKQIPVYNMTNYPDTAGQADYGNFHSYPTMTSSCTGGGLIANAASQQKVMPGYSLVNTELGASTQPQVGAMDQVTQARFLLSCILDNASAGVKETYLYQLADGYSDPTGKNTQMHYGLFDFYWNPKVAANVLRFVNSWLIDTGPTANTFTLNAPAWSVKGLPSTGKSLTVQRSDGCTNIYIWNEVPLATSAGAEASVSTSTVVFTLPRKYQTVGVADPITGQAWWASNSNTITVGGFGKDPMIAIVSPN